MCNKFVAWTWYGCFIALHGASAQSFVVRNGDLHQCLTAKQTRQLTFDGTYVEVALSPNNTRLAALRKLAEDQLAIDVFPLPWISAVPANRIQGPVVFDEYVLPIEGSLQWSNDGNTLYYLLSFSSTSAFLAKTTLKTMETRALCPAIRFIIIRKGEYADKLIVLKRKQTLVGPWYWYWLVDEAGAEIGPIGGREALSEFCDRYCKGQSCE